jgi:hypothetical protein
MGCSRFGGVLKMGDASREMPTSPGVEEVNAPYENALSALCWFNVNGEIRTDQDFIQPKLPRA